MEGTMKPSSSGKLLTKAFLLAEIEKEDSLTIEYEDQNGVVVWDEEDEKEIPFHFLENMNPAVLADKMYVSKDIPHKYQVDKQALAKYLWGACDRNAFITLDELVVIWSLPEKSDSFDPPEFIDSGTARLQKRFEDEYALELGRELLGQMWFERNVVVVNMGEIVRIAESIERENWDTDDPYFSAENQIMIGLLTTAIHELRHLQMDTNVLLPEEDYPLVLGCEDAVEEYCRMAFEYSKPSVKVLPFLFVEEHPSLAEQMDSAAERISTESVKWREETMMIDRSKLNDYIREEMILEFSSPEACMEYFNTYDGQRFASIEEMKSYQGPYGFGHGGKWYHVNYDEALDVWHPSPTLAHKTNSIIER